MLAGSSAASPTPPTDLAVNGLSHHFAPNASHASLPFHPHCPLCDEERFLSAAGLHPRTSRRLGVGAAAAMFLFASSLPSIAAATPSAPAPPAAIEPDSESEGTGQADQSPGPDEDGPETEGGGLESGQVEESTPSLVTPGDDSNPNEGENESGPVEAGPPPDEPNVPEQQSGPPGSGVAPTPGDQVPLPRNPGPPQEHTGSRESPGDESSTEAPRTKLDRDPSSNTDRARSKGRQDQSRPGTGQGHATRPLDPTSAEPDGAAKANDSANRGGARNGHGIHSSTQSPSSSDIHVVQPGDTLWAIATARLGKPSAPADVAREVQRLWNLNAQTIGTGDPDLLLVGQQLRLR